MPSHLTSPRQRYQKALAHGFVADSAQLPALDALEACYQSLHKAADSTRGVYLWGPVGRGKTWLMDQFHQSLQVPALRMHFHHFMRWLHRELFQLTGTAEPLRVFADHLASQYRVLCFDELFVSDIADAMLLGGVFQYLFERKVVLVATSNQPPDRLYEDGFNRDQFLPAISALQDNMDVIHLSGAQDHRLHQRSEQQRYWVKGSNKVSIFPALFQDLSGGREPQLSAISLGSRELHCKAKSADIIWCDYAELCGQPFSALDYIALCDQLKALMLSGIPELSAKQQSVQIARGTEDAVEQVAAGDRQLPVLSRRDDAVRRFIALVDECYDRGVVLYLEAAVPLEKLYTQGGLLFPFQRTLSRLQAMQYADYGEV